MTQDLRLTVKAVLARFNGDKDTAIHYCLAMAARYPHLAEEYLDVGIQLRRGV